MTPKLRSWSVLLMSCTLILLGLPVSAFADTPQLLMVDPAAGPVGSTVTVRGTGWTPEYYAGGVRISFDHNHGNGVLTPYAEEMTVLPDSDGELSFETTIPSSFAEGDVLSFSGLIGNGSGARANFTVTAGTGPRGNGNAKADLEPTAIYFDKAAAAVGRNVHFDAGVINTGDQGSEGFNIKWFVDGKEVGA